MVPKTLFLKFVPFPLDISQRNLPFPEDKKQGKIQEGYNHFNYWGSIIRFQNQSETTLYKRKPREAVKSSHLNALLYIKSIRIYIVPKKLSSESNLDRNFSENSVHFPANIYLFKIYNRSTRRKMWNRLKLTIKTPERRHFFEKKKAKSTCLNQLYSALVL